MKPKPEITVRRARQLAHTARIKRLPDIAKAWEEYADMLDRNRPPDGKSRASGEAA